MNIMKKILNQTRIKIILIFLISFIAITTVSPQIFLADSPVINPDFIARLQNYPAELASVPGQLIAGLNPFGQKDQFADVKQVTPPPNVVFKAISKGVYAGEDPQTGKTYLKVEAGTKYRIAGTVTINGKEYPKIEFVE